MSGTTGAALPAQPAQPARDWPSFLEAMTSGALQLESLVVDGGDLIAATGIARGLPLPPPGRPGPELAARVDRVQQVVHRVLGVLARQRDVLAEDIAAVPLRSHSGTGVSDHTSLGGRLDIQG